ncbi:MAG: MBL fold metallo-hydrolase, partial [Bdellovibrionales bacterium]|nr:MBL fold metallo-hydrolase [Bdellovibrionales bacterium]
LSCEQVYKLWATDPHLIRVLDLRSEDEFQRAHVPGAIRIAPQQLRRELDQLSGRLAVIVAAEELAEEVGLELSDREDAVLMNQCHRWMELQHPIAGDGLKATILELKRRSGMGTTKALLENGTVFHQLFESESSTYTYIIADRNTKEAAIIDPVLETVDRDLKLIDELGLRLVYVLDTHIHADHITGAGEIRKRTDAKTAVSRRANVDCVDIALEDGQELTLGNKKIKVIATPGHTDTCLTFGFEGMIFTGDALLIRGCGRTDFQQGSADDLYDSVHEKLFQLPDDTIVYPGHDYRGLTSTTIGLEKAHNPRLGLKNSREEFKKIMSELKLANPKKIHEAVPANLACGRPKDSRVLHPQIVDGIPEVTVDDVLRHLPDAEAGRVKLIDVRRPDEFNGELGHIKGAKLVTLGPDLTKFLENGNRAEEIVFVCRSGGRSGTAAAESIKLGYKFTINMAGGMIRWNEKKFKTENN